MEMIQEAKCVYKPIKFFFETSVYKKCQQLCWQLPSYKDKIAMLAALLVLQQRNHLPSEVTAEDMTNLLLEEDIMKMKLQDFEFKDLDEEVARPLLDLTWRVIKSLKIRDIGFETRQLLDDPDKFPPCFLHSRLLHLAKAHVRPLADLHGTASKTRLVQLREVVMEVTPKVIQSLWLPPPDTHLNMPSQQLSRLAVGLTKAVEDHVCRSVPTMAQKVKFSRSIRDSIVLTIVETMEKICPQNILRMKLNSFAIDILKTITEVAAGAIVELFQARDTQDPDNVEEDEELLLAPVTSKVNWKSAVESESLIHKDILLNPPLITVAECKNTGTNEPVEKPETDKSEPTKFTFLNFMRNGLVIIHDFIKFLMDFFL